MWDQCLLLGWRGAAGAAGAAGAGGQKLGRFESFCADVLVLIRQLLLESSDVREMRRLVSRAPQQPVFGPLRERQISKSFFV